MAVFVGGPIALFAVISLLVWIGCEVAAARRRTNEAAYQSSSASGAATHTGTANGDHGTAAWWGVPDHDQDSDQAAPKANTSTH